MGDELKAKVIIPCLFLNLFIVSCNRQVQPVVSTVQSAGDSIPASVTSKPAEPAVSPIYTTVPQSGGNLPDTVEVDGDIVVFKEWGFSIELPSNVWEFNPKLYNRESGFEGFGFLRKVNLIDGTGKGFTPSIGVLFYLVPDGTQLTNFSVILRARMGESFPSIESMFGYEGSELILKIPAIGYYGHLGEGNQYSVYVVHAVKGAVGVQVSFEIVDSVLDQAKPEFFNIMQSLEFSP